MRNVMFDVVKRAAETLTRKRLRQQLRDLRPRATVLQSVKHQSQLGGIGDEKTDLAQEVGSAVLIDRDVLHVVQLQPRLAQTVGDGSDGKPAQCLTRRKRSSSAAATSKPSRTSAAEESP